MNLLKFTNPVFFHSRKIFFPPRFYFSEKLNLFTDIFERKAAEEQNKKYSSGFLYLTT